MSDRFVKAAKINDIEKRREPSKHYVYIINVLWSDNTKQVICRRYNAFFELQTSLIDQFPDDAGVSNPTSRILPFLPGKILFGRSNVREVALKRKDGLNDYLEKLVKLPEKISQAKIVLKFLEASAEDVKSLLNAGGGKRAKKTSTADSISDPVLLEQYIVISNFKKSQRNQVSLAEGDTVEVIEKHENGWWFVSIEDEQGWVPSSYLEPIDGKGTDQEEEVDCRGKESKHICSKAFTASLPDELTLKLGDVVDILAKCNDGWWKVQLSNSQQGYVPLNHLKKIPKNAEGDIIKSIIEDEPKPGKEIKRFETAPRKKTIKRKAQNDKMVEKAKGLEVSSTSTKKKEKVIYIASSSYKAPDGQGNLKFSEGDELDVIEKSPNGWWYVRYNNEEGWVPSNMAQRQRGHSNVDSTKKPIKQQYITVGGYKATEDTGISFTPGKLVEVLEKDPCGWWFVRIGKDEGWAPSTFLEETKDAVDGKPSAAPRKGQNTPPAKPDKQEEGEQYVALGNYQDDDEEMLSFTKGQKVLVLEKDDGGWWMAKLGNKKGWVPSNFLSKV